MMKSRKWAVALIGLAVFSLAMVPMFTNSKLAGAAGASPTAGAYTYVVEGQETGFPFDPINRQSGLLVPSEVFENQGFKVSLAGNTVNVSRGSQGAALTLGSANVSLFGVPAIVNPAAMRVSDHIFLPAALAAQWGVDIALDGTYVYVHDNGLGQPAPTQMSRTDYANLLQGRQLNGATVRSDNNQPLTATLTLLNPAIVADSNFTLDPNLRARAQALLPNYTLVLVDLKNTTGRSGIFQLGSLFLVDQAGNQFGVTGTVLPVSGQNVGTRIVPGAEMQSVVVFGKVPAASSSITVWYDTNNAAVGSFTSVQ